MDDNTIHRPRSIRRDHPGKAYRPGLRSDPMLFVSMMPGGVPMKHKPTKQPLAMRRLNNRAKNYDAKRARRAQRGK